VRSNVEAQMMAVIDTVPELADRVRAGQRAERIYGATQLPSFLRKPYGPGWALVGDVGCHKDPARALSICDALRDAELLAASLTEAFSGARSEQDSLGGYQQRRNAATMEDYEANIRAALFTPLAPQILETRAAARDDPHAMTSSAWPGKEGSRGRRPPPGSTKLVAIAGGLATAIASSAGAVSSRLSRPRPSPPATGRTGSRSARTDSACNLTRARSGGRMDARRRGLKWI
jgi:hypothetical protein